MVEQVIEHLVGLVCLLGASVFRFQSLNIGIKPLWLSSMTRPQIAKIMLYDAL